MLDLMLGLPLKMPVGRAALGDRERRTLTAAVQPGLFDAEPVPAGLPDSGAVLLDRLAAGETVVVRLPGLYQPYGPLLRHLRDAPVCSCGSAGTRRGTTRTGSAPARATPSASR
ncbi:hypothetical protein [Candidatus Frankia alpina]|uniref:hypothetical protein n=1 Tax=Candidatus Frankia alpina TaxID=2699483 RepID=UPI0013D379A2|nr:hypothetical protein [Candidatus Frankia alpina]